MQNSGTVRVGLAVGGGTGPELAEVFTRALAAMAGPAGVRVEVVRSPQIYHTYGPVAALPPAAAARAAAEDADDYVRFVRELAAGGVRACFRTAFNAQALYLAREALLGVKIETLRHADGEMLLVRDETQGFYAGGNDEPVDPSIIRRDTRFSRENTRRVLDFAAEFAERHWSGARIDRFVVACKFHLLDSRFSNWVREYERERGIVIDLWQPDTTNRHLLRGSLNGRVLIVGANEWADIAHADLIARFGHGAQEERASRNIYLCPELAGFVEYQTVHGSADDIGGRGCVNPAATLRAAAGLLEEIGGVTGATARMERALGALALRGVATPDVGGAASTRDVVEAALAAYAGDETPPPSDLLVVVDLQNDFLAADGRFGELGLIDPAGAEACAGRVAELLDGWRERGQPVVFVRTLAEEERLPATLRERNRRNGRAGWLRPGSRGADFFRVAPRPGEAVFTKSGYDPFLEPAFEAWVRRLAPARLVLAGAFTDVCVDAAARTAFQKGWHVAVVADATIPLHREQEEALAFARKLYDAETPDTATLLPALRA